MSLTKTEIGPLVAGLKCCCPRCGEGKLFAGYLTIREKCEVCGLDFSFADPADGPAFFAMCGVSFTVIAFWTAWVIADHPPVWLELAVIMPAMILGCLATLRPVKAWLVASEYYHKARDIDFTKPNADGSFSSAATIASAQTATTVSA